MQENLGSVIKRAIAMLLLQRIRMMKRSLLLHKQISASLR